MSLVRTAVVVGLAIAMMPSDKAQQAALYDKAAAAVAWTATFCDRNEATCTQAAAAWTIFKAKAEFAGGLAYDAAIAYITDRGPTPSAADGMPSEPMPVASRGTLKPADMVPAWRGRSASASGL